MTILPNPDVLPPPKIGEEVEIELSTGTVTGKIAGWRVQGAGLWMLTLSLPGGGTELLTAERASDGGWYVHDCRSIGRARQRRVGTIFKAGLIRTGMTIKTPSWSKSAPTGSTKSPRSSTSEGRPKRRLKARSAPPPRRRTNSNTK